MDTVNKNSVYTPEQIKNILWNVFELTVENIEFVNENDGNYIFHVYLEDDTMTSEYWNKLEELNDSDLFDIENKGNYFKIMYLNPYVLEFYQFKRIYEMVNENTGSWISFDDKQVKSLVDNFNRQNVKYHSNNFFKSIISQLQTKKKLSKIQFDNLNFLLKNGKTKYEAGLISNRN